MSGGVTKWSEKSEMMSTLADEHGHEAIDAIGRKTGTKRRRGRTTWSVLKKKAIYPSMFGWFVWGFDK